LARLHCGDINSRLIPASGRLRTPCLQDFSSRQRYLKSDSTRGVCRAPAPSTGTARFGRNDITQSRFVSAGIRACARCRFDCVCCDSLLGSKIYLFPSDMTWQASFTELPSEIVDLLKITSPSLLKTAILLWCANKAFPPSWSSVITKSALSRRFVTVICGQRWFSVLIISAVCGRAPPENELEAPHPLRLPPAEEFPRVSQD
jgi:hypothetical protein